MQELTKKYKHILNDYEKKYHVDIVNIVDKSINYIKNKYDKYNLNYKISGVYVIIKIYLNKKNFNSLKIEKTIDDYFNYFDNEYHKYMNTLVLISDEFYADLSFYDKYINKKIKEL